MNILILNTHDIEGGAARAAYRLHKGLQHNNVDSKMLVQVKSGDDSSVIGPKNKLSKGVNKLRPHLDTFPLSIYRNRHNLPWGVSWIPNNTSELVQRLNPDIVHLHWICGGFVSFGEISKLDCPVVWTLHDMWAFTGGCCYAGDCKAYFRSCGSCPQLNSGSGRDISYQIWNRKLRHLKKINLTVVSPSRWLAECAKLSFLFRDVRVEVIPNGLDLTQFKPIDKKIAREILGLPLNRKFILFGAMNAASDSRKGFQNLQPALQQLAVNKDTEKAELIVFGSSQPADPPDFGLQTRYLGRLHDDVSLALLYSAADVFVAPSIQENLANTVMEALACGTPCVAFDIGGMPDMIEHRLNGYLARPFEPSDLAAGIAWVLSDDSRCSALARRAREKAEAEFEIQSVAGRYAKLYGELLRNK